MFEVLIWTIVIFGCSALLAALSEVFAKVEEYVKWRCQWSIGHLNYKPKRFRTKRNYCG